MDILCAVQSDHRKALPTLRASHQGRLYHCHRLSEALRPGEAYVHVNGTRSLWTSLVPYSDDCLDSCQRTGARKGRHQVKPPGQRWEPVGMTEALKSSHQAESRFLGVGWDSVGSFILLRELLRAAQSSASKQLASNFPPAGQKWP